MKAKLMGLLRDEEGQGMAEYGLILGLVAIVAIVGLGLLGQGLDTMFDNVLAALGL